MHTPHFKYIPFFVLASDSQNWVNAGREHLVLAGIKSKMHQTVMISEWSLYMLFIESLKAFNFMFSAIYVQESWLFEGSDTSLNQLEWMYFSRQCMQF